jgi:hypothetical protein
VVAKLRRARSELTAEEIAALEREFDAAMEA